jgi:hypothetical protein
MTPVTLFRNDQPIAQGAIVWGPRRVNMGTGDHRDDKVQALLVLDQQLMAPGLQENPKPAYRVGGQAISGEVALRSNSNAYGAILVAFPRGWRPVPPSNTPEEPPPDGPDTPKATA